MIIATDFTTNRITLIFESTGLQINLTDEETKEFNERMKTLIKQVLADKKPIRDKTMNY